ncbi:MAG: hypothetical protein C4345_05325 [Chloroflexota bacterium]
MLCSLTKGLTALAVELFVAAEAMGLSEPLQAELQASQLALLCWIERQAPGMPPKAYRWVGEIEEIAEAFGALGLTPRMHEGAAAFYRFVARTPLGQDTLETRRRGCTLDDLISILPASSLPRRSLVRLAKARGALPSSSRRRCSGPGPDQEGETMDDGQYEPTLSGSGRATGAQPEVLRLHLRRRVETFRGSNDWDVVIVPKEIPVPQVAVLLCDVWDNHWCRGAVERLNAMVPRMEQAVGAARRRGVQIIHAPSETMDFYAGTPYRQRIQAVPHVEPSEPLALDDPPLPIDASDGGCDTGEKPWHRAWTRQHPAITICGDDVVSDNGREIYSFLRHRGIDTLVILGVHTNMCVLNRSFGIKQMTRWGVHCVLVRDLTDAMYNPQMPPYVSHDEGTALVIEHIEKYWCPTILSQDLLT